MVAGEQHVRHAASLPFGGPGIVRIFQQVARERLLRRAVGRAHHAGQQSNHRIEQHQRRQFAAGQHVVADADLFHPAGIDHALIDALVAAAEQDDAGSGRVALHIALRQRPAARRKEHKRPVIGHGGNGGVHHVGAQHHPSPTAERRVIDRAMPVGSEVTNIHRVAATRCQTAARDRQANAPEVRGTSPETASTRTRARSSRTVMAGLASHPRLEPAHACPAMPPAPLISSGGTTSTRPRRDIHLRDAARVNGTSSGGPLSRAISRLAPAP